MLISIIIPCFNEEKVIETTFDQLLRTLVDSELLQYEFLFIDDGSSDNTANIISHLAERHHRTRLIKFSRNFGHQAAVSAGIRHCQGDLAAIIDADLQDPPQVIPQMVWQLLETKSNVVYGVRKRRKGETIFKRGTAKLYYILLNKLSEVPLPRDTGDFRVIDRKVIDAFNGLGEKNKYIRGLISWMGFKQTPFYYVRNPRHAGSTKYTLVKMIRFACTGVFYFSKKPLKIATTFGFCSVAIATLLSAWVLYNKLANPTYLISGWASVILTVMYFGGVQLLTIGILGHYIGSLFDEVKRRPEYIIAEEMRSQRSHLGRRQQALPANEAQTEAFRVWQGVRMGTSRSSQDVGAVESKT